MGHGVSFVKSVLKHLSLEYQIDFNAMDFVYTKYFKKIITGIRLQFNFNFSNNGVKSG
jgi:hypothetical protein